MERSYAYLFTVAYFLYVKETTTTQHCWHRRRGLNRHLPGLPFPTNIGFGETFTSVEETPTYTFVELILAAYWSCN